jgi:hypothetical protein
MIATALLLRMRCCGCGCRAGGAARGRPLRLHSQGHTVPTLRAAATMRLLVLVALVLALAPDLAGAGTKKKKKQSSSAARKCAVCDWMVGHLQQRAEEEEAKGTSFEMGWRLKDDGTRVAKRVSWAQSELGFGAAVEAACAGGSEDEADAGGPAPLKGLVQVALGEELGLRPPEDGGADEADHTLREDPLELFRSSCLEFVFEEEAALDAIRDAEVHFSAPKKGLSPAVQMAREVCTSRAKACPKSRWQRWYGWYGAEAGTPSLVPHVPRPVEAMSDDNEQSGSWEAAASNEAAKQPTTVAGWMCVRSSRPPGLRLSATVRA